MAAAAARSKLARLAVSAVGTTTADQRMTFTRFSPGAIREVIDLGVGLGGFGTLAHDVENVRENLTRVNPSGSFRPSVGEWARWLEFILLGTVAGDSYALGDTLKTRSIYFDDTQTVWSMDDVVCSRAVIRASAGGEVSLDVDMVGTDFATGATFPVGTTLAAGPRLLFRDLSVTVAGTAAVKCASVEIVIDHGVNAERFFYGKATAGGVNMDRTVTVSLVMPYGVHAALRDAGAVDDGVEVVVPFTYAGNVLAFTFPAVMTPTGLIDANVPDEIMLPWNGQAYRKGGDSGTKEIVTTLTVAP